MEYSDKFEEESSQMPSMQNTQRVKDPDTRGQDDEKKMTEEQSTIITVA